MAALSIKNLANGQLANSKGTIYTVPAGTDTIVKSIILVNTNTTLEYVNLYFCAAGGTSRRIIPKDYALPANQSVVFETLITMGTEADLIQGDTTTASKVDYVISGVEYA